MDRTRFDFRQDREFPFSRNSITNTNLHAHSNSVKPLARQVVSDTKTGFLKST